MRLRVEITSILETHRQLLETLIPLGAPLSDAERAESTGAETEDSVAFENLQEEGSGNGATSSAEQSVGTTPDSDDNETASDVDKPSPLAEPE